MSYLETAPESKLLNPLLLNSLWTYQLGHIKDAQKGFWNILKNQSPFWLKILKNCFYLFKPKTVLTISIVFLGQE